MSPAICSSLPIPTVESRTNNTAEQAALQARLGRLQGYLSGDAHNAHLLGDVADLQLQLGRWDDAKATLAQLLDLVPEDAQARYRLAVAERALGQAEVAQLLLAALVGEGHAHPAVLQELARSEAQLGRWDAVVKTLAPLDATALSTEEGDTVRLLRVRALHHLGDLQSGLAEAQTWRQARGPNLPTIGLAALATLHLDAEQLDAAAELVASAAPDQLASNAELATAAGFIELSRGRADSAKALLSQGAHQQPALGRAHLGLGLAAAYTGDLSGAVAALKAATVATPSHLGSWHALAWMQMLNQDLIGAEASLQAALAQDANFGETHGGLALLAALRGDREAAERHLRTGTRLDPQGVNVTVARVALQQGGGQLDSRVLGPALQRFMGLATTQSPTMQSLMARMMPRSR
ncbi:MAG: tetratricopeptide repeat protein [Sphingomonas sp.]|nr:tetratricopeptide repeat protein [Sphingomonas sp.]